MRLLEGEIVVYRGIGWIVKGFQHPENYVVAYPRYDLANRRKLTQVEEIRLVEELSRYWSCIDRCVPMISVDECRPVVPRASPLLEEFISLLSDATGIDRANIAASGSQSLGIESSDPDLDIVIYASNPRYVYEALLELRRLGILKPLGLGDAWREYLSKHSKTMSFETYLRLRKNSVLQGTYRGHRYSVRIVPYTHGFRGCVEPVKVVMRSVEATVTIVEPITSFTTPATYEAIVNGRKMLFRTFRTLFTELEPSTTIRLSIDVELVGGRYVAVPDHAKRVEILDR